LFIFKIFKTAQLFFIVACLYLNFQILPTKQQQLLVSESILGHLEILDLASNATDSVRVLRINNIVQTEMSLRTKKSVSAYIQLLDTLIPQRQKQGDALILGLGGGLNANLLCDKNYRTVGVEIDPRIIDAAKIYFGLNKNVKTVCADARYFLNAEKKKFDLVLIDIFKAEEQPSHILTTESLLQLKQNLNDSAMLYINWHGYVQGKIGQGTSILNNTLIQAGFKVQMCSTSKDENYRNVMFVASLNRLKPQPFLLNETFFATNLVNTDDLPLLEKYNADANKIWRVNYLRYYQQQ
jgi:hypothetical protein